MPTRSDQQPPFQPVPAQAPQTLQERTAVVMAPPPLSPEEQERNARLQAKAQALREAPRAVPVTDVAVIIGIRTRDNGRQETMIDIGQDTRILECTNTVKEKVRAVTEEGQFIGFEPTGEYELTLKVKYLKE